MSFPAPTGLAGNNPFALSVALTWNPVSIPDANTSLLLHCDGTNGSTTFPDSGPNALTVTAVTGVTVSTAEAEFGTGSAHFPGTSGNALDIPITSSGPMDLGSGDLTIEFWIFPLTLAGSQGALLNTSDTVFGVYYEKSTSNLNGVLRSGSVTSPSNSVPVNMWTAVAIVISGTTLTIYINGVAGTPTSCSSRATTATIFQIGTGTGGSFNGYIDEIRITKGVARYLSNYTPAGPFSGSVSPIGYDLYRGGTSIGTVTGATAFIDTVPSAGTYNYTVACWDGSADDSPQSSPPVPVVVIGGGGGGGGGPGAPGGGGLINWVGNTGTLTAKFVPPAISKAIMIANPGTINPRVYVPEEDTIARLPLPRLPL